MKILKKGGNNIMEKLYTRVSDSFNPKKHDLIIAAPGLNTTWGFTEKGSDTADYTKSPIISTVEVDLNNVRYARNKDIDRAVEELGVKDSYFYHQVLLNPLVRDHLSSKGFNAFWDFETPFFTEPYEVGVFWDKSIYKISKPLKVYQIDDDKPYEISLKNPASKNKQIPKIKTTFCMAELTEIDEFIRAFGKTPEQAVNRLLKEWDKNHSEESPFSKNYICNNRDDIKVYEIDPNELLMSSEFGEPSKPVIDGVDPRFDKLFETFYDVELAQEGYSY